MPLVQEVHGLAANMLIEYDTEENDPHYQVGAFLAGMENSGEPVAWA